MAFANEHSSRQTDPLQYTSFTKKELATGITAIIGTNGIKSEVQSVRFNEKHYTAEEAKLWLQKNDMKDTVEAAVKKQIKLIVINKVSFGVELGYALDSAKPREAGNITPLCIARTSLPLEKGDVVIANPINVRIKKITDLFAIEGDAEIVNKTEGRPSSARDIIQEAVDLIEKSDIKEEALNTLKIKQPLPIPTVNAQGVIINKTIPLLKSEAKQLVYGVVYEPFNGSNTDSQGDYANENEIEKAAHKFMSNLKKYSDSGSSYMHEERIPDKAEIVESYIAPHDMVVGNERIRKGSWMMTTHIIDKDLWGQVMSGELDAYSMEGRAEAGDEVLKSEGGKITKRNLVNMDIDAVALVDKGANKKRFCLKKRNKEMETPEIIQVLKGLDEATLKTVMEAVKPEEVKKVEPPVVEPPAVVAPVVPVVAPAPAVVKDAAWYMANPKEDIPDELIPTILEQMKI